MCQRSHIRLKKMSSRGLVFSKLVHFVAIVSGLVATALPSRGDFTATTKDGWEEPVTRMMLRGEWSGLGAVENVLVTLDLGRDPDPNAALVSGVDREAEPESSNMLLAVTESTEQNTVSTVYSVGDLRVEGGRFSLGTPSHEILLEVEAKRTWGSGSGHGWLTLNEKGRKPHKIELYFFYLRGESWMKHMLERVRYADARH